MIRRNRLITLLPSIAFAVLAVRRVSSGANAHHQAHRRDRPGNVQPRGAETAAGRGRQASRPSDVPKPGWRDILLRTNAELTNDNVSIVAAGVAFYAMLALFPALAAAVSIYGLVADPAQVQEQLASLGGMLPGEAQNLLSQQLNNIVTSSGTALGFGALIALLFALYSASSGIKSLIIAMNIAYGEQEKRSFLRLNIGALLLTLGAIVFVLLALTLVVALPAILGTLGLGSAVETLVSVLRWPLLAVALMFGLAVLYRFGPSREKPQWKWVSWGAVAATALWVLGSLAFSYYVSNFASYNETYGAIGSVIILLMWLYLSAYVVILGAELNAEMEHQTRRDTTTGAPKPMGQRRAQMADTVGQTP